MSSCVNCGELSKSKICTQCDGCQGPLHLDCVGLSESDIKFTRAKSKAIKVVCNTCNNNMAQFKDLKALLVSMQNEFAASINSLREDFETRLKALEVGSNSEPRTEPAFGLEEVVQEVVERQSRKTNIILFGLPEQSMELTSELRANNDCTAVRSVISFLDPALDTSFLRVHRLGRFNRAQV